MTEKIQRVVTSDLISHAIKAGHIVELLREGFSSCLVRTQDGRELEVSCDRLADPELDALMYSSMEFGEVIDEALYDLERKFRVMSGLGMPNREAWFKLTEEVIAEKGRRKLPYSKQELRDPAPNDQGVGLAMLFVALSMAEATRWPKEQSAEGAMAGTLTMAYGEEAVNVPFLGGLPSFDRELNMKLAAFIDVCEGRTRA